MKSGIGHIVINILFFFLCIAVFAASVSVSYFAANRFSGSITTDQNNNIVIDSKPKNEQEETTSAMSDDFFVDKAVFVGDSRIHGFSTYGYIPSDKVFALDGSNQKTILESEFVEFENGAGGKYSLLDALEMTKPEYILIGLGINGMPSLDGEEFLIEYQNLTDQILEVTPESKIVIMSIQPVSLAKENSAPLMSNERIDEFNGYLKSFAQINDFEYMDVSYALKNDYNALDVQYDAGDGLHFSNTAYRKLIEEMNKMVG